MKALVLAAGYATRLYPITLNRPKPLLEVAGRPIVDYIIDRIERLDSVDEVYVVTNNKFHIEFEKWNSISKRSLKIEVINDGTDKDENKLGAIGDINFVINKKKIDDDLLVIGGDNLFDFDLNGFAGFSKLKGKSAIGLYDIKDINEAKKYGVVKIDGKNRIVDFQEKSESPVSTLIAMCVYIFPREGLRLISRYIQQGNSPDAPGFYIKWLHKVEAVYGYIFKEDWFDIGDKKVYERVCNIYSKRRKAQ